VAIQRLRIHMAIANSRQRLHAEKEAIKKPMPASAARDTVLLETVERGEKKVEPDVKTGDERGELRPPQTEQPAIDIAPPPCVGIDFNELELAGAKGNSLARPMVVELVTRFPFHVHLICTHRKWSTNPAIALRICRSISA
jgi:hypothetical protein